MASIFVTMAPEFSIIERSNDARKISSMFIFPKLFCIALGANIGRSLKIVDRSIDFPTMTPDFLWSIITLPSFTCYVSNWDQRHHCQKRNITVRRSWIVSLFRNVLVCTYIPWWLSLNESKLGSSIHSRSNSCCTPVDDYHLGVLLLLCITWYHFL